MSRERMNGDSQVWKQWQRSDCSVKLIGIVRGPDSPVGPTSRHPPQAAQHTLRRQFSGAQLLFSLQGLLCVRISVDPADLNMDKELHDAAPGCSSAISPYPIRLSVHMVPNGLRAGRRPTLGQRSYTLCPTTLLGFDFLAVFG